MVNSDFCKFVCLSGRPIEDIEVQATSTTLRQRLAARQILSENSSSSDLRSELQGAPGVWRISHVACVSKKDVPAKALVADSTHIVHSMWLPLKPGGRNLSLANYSLPGAE